MERFLWIHENRINLLILPPSSATVWFFNVKVGTLLQQSSGLLAEQRERAIRDVMVAVARWSDCNASCDSAITIRDLLHASSDTQHCNRLVRRPPNSKEERQFTKRKLNIPRGRAQTEMAKSEAVSCVKMRFYNTITTCRPFYVLLCMKFFPVP